MEDLTPEALAAGVLCHDGATETLTRSPHLLPLECAEMNQIGFRRSIIMMTVAFKNDNKAPLLIPPAARRKAGFKSGQELEVRASSGVLSVRLFWFVERSREA